MSSNRQERTAVIKLVEFSLILVVLTLPFSILINSYCIVFFAFAAIISNKLTKKWANLRESWRIWIWPMIYYLWMAVRLYTDESPARTPHLLETGFSLIVFPVIFGSIDKLGPKLVRRVLVAFAVANIGASFYCLWKSYEDYKASDYINFFFYHHLSNHIGISAIYYSMYCVFSVYVLLYYFLLRKKKTWIRLLAILAIAYLGVFILMLSSKAFIVILYLSALGVVVYSFYYLRYKLSATIMFLLLIAIPFLLVKFPYVTERLRDTQIREYRGAADNQNGLAVRGVLWESTWALIKQRPIVGWGYFYGKDVLQYQYLQKGFEEGVKDDYNSHNQYLFTWLCYGLIGLITLLVFFWQLLRSFLLGRQFLGICLLLMFILANNTECMLETHKGIVFFLAFSNLLLYHLTSRISSGRVDHLAS